MTTPIDHENAISLAVLQTEMAHMKATLADVKFAGARQDAKLDKVLEQMSQAKGGWRTLLLLGGASGAVGSIATLLAAHWKG